MRVSASFPLVSYQRKPLGFPLSCLLNISLCLSGPSIQPHNNQHRLCFLFVTFLSLPFLTTASPYFSNACVIAQTRVFSPYWDVLSSHYALPQNFQYSVSTASQLSHGDTRFCLTRCIFRWFPDLLERRWWNKVKDTKMYWEWCLKMGKGGKNVWAEGVVESWSRSDKGELCSRLPMKGVPLSVMVRNLSLSPVWSVAKAISRRV